MDFYWLEDGIISGGSKPVSSFDFQFLNQKGIKRIVNLTRASLDEQLLALVEDVRTLHLPIRAGNVPTQAQVDVYLKFIRIALDKEYPIFVHCQEGYDRTGTLLVIYLMHFRDMTAKTAIKTVRKSRPTAIAMGQVRFLQNNLFA